MIRTIVVAFAAIVWLTTAAASAAQSIDHGGNYFGDVVVEPGQTVDGDLNVVAGNVTVAGTIDGDVNVVGGSVYERPGAAITGRVNTVGGEVVSDIVPWVPAPEAARASHADDRIFWRLAWDVIVLLIFLIFPVRTRMALDRLERHPGLSVAAGTLGFVGVIPLALLLIVSVILIPLVPLEFVAIVAGVSIGTAALSLLVGRRLYELLNPSQTPSPLAALLIGLALLTAAELVPIVGALVTILVAVIGLGAAILTMIGEESLGHPAAPRSSSVVVGR